MFSVVYQPAFNVILCTLGGLLSVEEVGHYADAVEPIIRRAADRPQGYNILIDVSACAIQPQVVVAAFQAHVASVPNARRCAFVTGHSVVRMQIRRILSGSVTARAFEQQEVAREWLLRSDDRSPE